MRTALLLGLAVFLTACDAGPTGEPGATYPFAGDHPLVTLAELPDVRPAVGADAFRNVEATVAAVAPCSRPEQADGTCVSGEITLTDGSTEAYVLPADDPEQFAVGGRYRVTLDVHQGDDSVVVYLFGYTRL